MQTVESLERQIRTAADLHSLVRTMKALAAVSIRQFELAVSSLADYQRTIELGLHVLLKNNPQSGVLARTAPKQNCGAIVFGSDQGMCGPLNDQIVAYSLEQMDRLGVDRENRMVLTVGTRPKARLEDAGQPVEETFSTPGSTSGITPAVQNILVKIDQWNTDGKVDKIVLFYCEHLTRASYRPGMVELLPIDQRWLQKLQEKPWPTGLLPTYTMDSDRLFSALVRQYLFVSLYRACAESAASENASRLASMWGAERNIEERITDLTKLFHQKRQTAITEELLDIAAGCEALGDELEKLAT